MIHCPDHKDDSTPFTLDLTGSTYEKYGYVKACKCEKCKKIYVNLRGEKRGSLGNTTKGYEVINIHKYYYVPDKLYVVKSSDLSELGRRKRLFSIPELVAVHENKYKYYGIPTKFDPEKKAFYITEKMYNKHPKLIRKLNTEIIYINDVSDLYIDYDNETLPNTIYVLEDKNFYKLTDNKAMQNKLKFTKGNNAYTMQVKCDLDNDRFYISDSVYTEYRNILTSLNIKLIYIKDIKNFVESNKCKFIPKNVYLVNIVDFKLTSKFKNYINVDSFTDNGPTLYKFPTKYNRNQNKYFITDATFQQYKDLFDKLRINVIPFNTEDHEINVVENANVNKKEKQNESKKFKRQQNIFKVDKYINQKVYNLTYGNGTIVQVKGSILFVNFQQNVQTYSFPDCVKTGILKFLDDNIQEKIIDWINCMPNIYVSAGTSSKNKNLVIQHTSYSDLRRIPGLIYKIQLIGSSNNHATRIHPVEDVEVKLAYKNPKSKTFDIVSIPMHYCRRCNKYFDMKQSFLQTLQKYNLDINYFAASFESETGQPIVFKQMVLREFSKLKLFGYSVGSNGLSTGARQELLDFILKNHLMTASEIKSQLQFNIRFIGKKNNMTNAVGDWEKDIDYVNDYIRSGKIHWKY